MRHKTSRVSTDPWLDRWLPLIRERADGSSVLELGCGRGADTSTLVLACHRTVAVEVSLRSIAEAQSRVPDGEFHCQDIRAPFPVGLASVGAIVASLSLHYFD